MPKAIKTICAAICTYNRYDLLALAVDSLLQQTISADQLSILIVDNSPDAQMAAAHARQYRGSPQITYVYEKIPGLSNARNVAANLSTAHVISYIDDDAIAAPDWAAHILEAFNAFDSVGVVGGRISPIWEIPRPEWLGNTLLGYVSAIDWGGDLRIAGDDEWFAGANISFLRQAVLDGGGFDTSLGRIGAGASLLSNEETKLTEKIKASGYKMVYAPAASVDHLVEQARLQQTWFRKRMVWQAISDYIAGSDRSLERLDHLWDWTLTYLSALKPDERAFRGLYAERKNSEDFKEQLSALYNYTFMLLAGFPGAR